MGDKNKKFMEFQILPFYFEIGWRVTIPLVLFVLGGVWLDNKLHTKPIFILLGILFSIVTSFWGIWSTIKKIEEKNK